MMINFEKNEDTKNIENDSEINFNEILNQIGGIKGAILSGIPVLAFIILNLKNFNLAIWGSLSVAFLIFIYQIIKKEKFSAAFSGVVGVLISALIAWKTGEPENYYLIGVVSVFLYFLIFFISVIINKPLVGIIRYNFFKPEYKKIWSDNKQINNLMKLNTLLWSLMFAFKACLQFYLYLKKDAAMLGIIKLITGYPLTIIFAGITYVIIKKSDLIIENLK